MQNFQVEPLKIVASTSNDGTKPRKQKYKKSTALVMYEWARNRPEYEEERERLRTENYTNEQTIERLAFFRLSAKVQYKGMVIQHNSKQMIKTIWK